MNKEQFKIMMEENFKADEQMWLSAQILIELTEDIDDEVFTKRFVYLSESIFFRPVQYLPLDKIDYVIWQIKEPTLEISKSLENKS